MTINRKHITNGGFLLGAVVFSNLLNFLFNALLGRWLSFEDFGLITLLITFYYISSVFTNALSSTINFSVAKIERTIDSKQTFSFFSFVMRKSVLIAVILAAAWLALTPLLMQFFHTDNKVLFVSFAIVIIFSTYLYAVIGYLQGSLRFGRAGLVLISEPITKLCTGIILTATGLGAFAYFSLPVSLTIAAVMGYLVLDTITPKKINQEEVYFKFPKYFYFTSVITGLGSIIFFSIDLILVKHFFSPAVTGQYAIISLIGKMLYFFSTLLNIFTLPLVARISDQNKLNKLFLLLLGGTVVLSSTGWILFGVLGNYTVPFLLGDKVVQILAFLPLYTLGIAFYAVSNVIVSFHLARQEYIFSYLLTISGFVFGFLILIRHANLAEITTNITITALLLLITLLVFHFIYKKEERTHAI